MPGLVSTHTLAPPLTSPTTRAGTPTASMPSAMTMPGGTVQPAAIRARLPTTARSRTVAPLPISASAWMTQPCTTHRWPTVAPSPTSVIGSSPPCSTEPSWMFAPRRMMIGPKSARSTAPYQIEASASTRTSPTRVAVGAIHASGLTWGSRPSKLKSGICPSCTWATFAPGRGLAAGPLAGGAGWDQMGGAPGYGGCGQGCYRGGGDRGSGAGDAAADGLGHGREQGGADRGTDLAAGVDHASDQALIGIGHAAAG